MAAKKRRSVGTEGAGSGGDVRDRFKQPNVIRPGARAGLDKAAPIGNPIKQLKDMVYKVPKSTNKPPTMKKKP